jgi:phage host-nuclease inhibitor protein Gam
VETHADVEIVTELNDLARTRFDLQVEMDAATNAYKLQAAALKATYTAEIADIQARIRPIDTRIWELLTTHRASLVEKSKKSFTTAVAKFQLREPKVTTKIGKGMEAGVMKVARKLGIVKQVADPPSREYVLNTNSFLAWLNQHPSLRRYFAPYLEETGGEETLSLQPNESYPVFHDSKRVSLPSVSIKKS